MKIRYGFVSNSSSSSFVMVFPIEYLTEFKAQHPIVGSLFDKIIEVQVMDDKKYGVYSDWSDAGGNSPWDDFEYEDLTPEQEQFIEDNDSEEYDPYYVKEAFENWLLKNKMSYISAGDDW